MTTREVGSTIGEVLQRYWGYPAFRDGQEAIVQDMVDGRDVLAVMSTGGGKSLCYQLPAMVTPGVTLVVSPLIALMADQVGSLKRRGVPAAFLNSSLGFAQREHAWNYAEHGGCRLFFVSPETLTTDVFQARAPRLGIARVAVDEAHCISEWGHDFRPAYLGIREAVACLGKVPVAAFTATAPPRVRKEIESLLELRDAAVHVGEIDRPNIRWSVHREVNITARVEALLASGQGSAVLYAGTRANTVAWADHLLSRGISCLPYHAGLDLRTRERAQTAWTEGSVRVVSATSAFGMGIDKPDVRLVVHTMLPASIEAYYQEAGRAGRDGQPAEAVLIASPADDERVLAWSLDQYPDQATVAKVYNVACDLASIAVGTTPHGPVVASADRISGAANLPEHRVTSALHTMDRMGVWRLQQPDSGEAWLDLSGFRSLLSGAAVSEGPAPVRRLAGALARVPDAERPDGLTRIRMESLGRSIGLNEGRVEEGLRFFQERGLLGTVVDGRTVLLELTAPRSRHPDLGADRLKRLRARARDRARDVVVYAGLRDCRRRMLRSYFGEAAPARCGRCDNCLGR